MRSPGRRTGTDSAERLRSCAPVSAPARVRAPSLGWGVTEIEIGRAKRARRVYSFDDVAIVPSRRTRDPEDVSISWKIDAFEFELPFIAAPMDSVVPLETATLVAGGSLREDASPRGGSAPCASSMPAQSASRTTLGWGTGAARGHDRCGYRQAA